MKKIYLLLSIALISCGPSREELNKKNLLELQKPLGEVTVLGIYHLGSGVLYVYKLGNDTLYWAESQTSSAPISIHVK
jgi:hypothetical protein